MNTSDMEGVEKYVYLSSSDSKDRFTKNTASEFEVRLPEMLKFEGEEWVCGLTEITLPGLADDSKSDFFCICSDICGASAVGDLKLPILRRLYLTRKNKGTIIFSDPFYVPLRQHNLEVIRMYIQTCRGKRPSFADGEAYSTLHIKRK